MKVTRDNFIEHLTNEKKDSDTSWVYTNKVCSSIHAY
jgi:hypothetical protein